jgi:dCTP deaminase
LSGLTIRYSLPLRYTAELSPRYPVFGTLTAPYAKPSKKIAGKSQTGLLNQVRDFIDTNQTTFTIILLILSSLQIFMTMIPQVSSFIRTQTIQTYPKENIENPQ